MIQVAKPIYRSHPISNLHYTFPHACPSTREPYFMIIVSQYHSRDYTRNVQVYVTSEVLSATCNRRRDDPDFFLVHADHSDVCDISSAGRQYKGRCPFILPNISKNAFWTFTWSGKKNWVYYNRRGMCRVVTIITFQAVTFLGVFFLFLRKLAFLTLISGRNRHFLRAFFLISVISGF